LASLPLFLRLISATKCKVINGQVLSIAVRVLLTLIEFVVRRALKREKTQLTGLYKEIPKKTTNKPEELLHIFSLLTKC
jgi:hypothetical protein